MRHTLLLALTALTACASTSEPAAPPNLAPVAGQPAPPNARLYADCIAQSAATGAFDRTSEGGVHMIRFTCTGAPARAFFNGLAARSASIGSEWTAGGRTWRSTNRVQRDLFGVDYCSSGGSADHSCSITLNAGDFLAGP